MNKSELVEKIASDADLFATQGLNIPVDFHLCDEQKPNSYGLDPRDFLDVHPSIYLDPMVSFSPSDLKILPDIMSYEYPMETLPGNDVQNTVPNYPPDLSILEKLKRQYPLRKPLLMEEHLGLRAPYLQYLINRIEKLTSKVISTLHSILQDRDLPVIFDQFDYRLHKIADGRLYIIELRLYPQ